MTLALNTVSLSSLVCLLILCGCAEKPSPTIVNTTKQQYVIFSVLVGGTGFGGDPVVDQGGEVFFDGLRVVAKDQVLIHAKAGKSAVINPRSIRVEARVHLELGSATISSDPPRARSVIHLVIDELLNAEYQ